MPDAETGGNVTTQFRITGFFIAFLAPLLALTLWPQLDLTISGLFYRAGDGFFLAENPFLNCLHVLASKGAWVLGGLLLVVTLLAALMRKPALSLPAKSWLFLFLALVIGPALIANVGFKDHWGRARPREVTEFGGAAQFSPALIPQEHGHKNSSFVAGDAAFGFYLPAVAYAVSAGGNRRKSRQLFWGGMILALLFSLARLLVGAHFLSDILFAAVFMTGSNAALSALFFGAKTTLTSWKEWFYKDMQG